MSKHIIILLGILSIGFLQAQNDSTSYKKKVLDSKELQWISSYYNQKGDHAAVTGGIGTEKLDDVASSVIIKFPIKEDGVLTVDAGLSAYSSASSSNVNPFDVSGASGGGGDDDDDDDNEGGSRLASPWQASSGPSKSDLYGYTNVNYAHSSDDRNKIFSVHGGFSSEYDYRSLNFGLGYAMLFNDKNTTVEIKGSAYFDKWKAIYATELKSYYEVDGNLNQGFFAGQIITPSENYDPDKFTFIDNTKRNTYAATIGFSQVLSPSIQMSLFGDFVLQQGLLSTPFHRVYFADRQDYKIEDFTLADDREKLPDSRTKFPLGVRVSAYLSDRFILRAYYRYYSDDWDLKSNTLQLELPVKLTSAITLMPTYRYYNQTAAKYFAPFNEHLSTEEFYTSDYDLSPFSANEFGGELRIAPPLGITKFGKGSWKNLIFRYQNYKRNIPFKANIITVDMNFAW